MEEGKESFKWKKIIAVSLSIWFLMNIVSVKMP